MRLYLVVNSRSAISEEIPMPQSVTPTNTPARRLLAMLDHKFAPPNRDGVHRFNTVHRQVCQSAFKFDPVSASNFDPFERRVLTVALVSSELAGIAEARRARVV